MIESANIVWEIQGIFTTKEEAAAACKNERYFVGPVELSKPYPQETAPWEGCEYPLA